METAHAESRRGIILRALHDWGEATALDLADSIGMEQKHVATYLARLRDQGLVRALEKRFDPPRLGGRKATIWAVPERREVRQSDARRGAG